MANSPSNKEKGLILGGIAIAGAIFTGDLMIPLGVAGGVPYIALVLLGLWSKRKRFIAVSAITGSLLTILGYYFSPPGGELWKVIFNRFLALFAIWVTAILCLLYKKSESKLEMTHQQLIHSEKLSATGRLAASIAHEFNNPICGIRNALERLIEKVPMEKGFMDSANIAVNECNRITKLISQLNDFHRPSTGKFEIFNIHETINEIIILMHKNLKDKNINLEKNYCQPTLMIKAIPDQIKQVILNLIQNAEESYAKGSGKISVTTEKLNSKIVIKIKDYGQGITKNNIEKIFDPFFTTKSKVKGIGLGLSVSYGIVENHGGSITAESVINEGSCFTMILPLEGKHENAQSIDINH